MQPVHGRKAAAHTGHQASSARQRFPQGVYARHGTRTTKKNLVCKRPDLDLRPGTDRGDYASSAGSCLIILSVSSSKGKASGSATKIAFFFFELTSGMASLCINAGKLTVRTAYLHLRCRRTSLEFANLLIPSGKTKRCSGPHACLTPLPLNSRCSPLACIHASLNLSAASAFSIAVASSGAYRRRRLTRHTGLSS